MEGPLLYRQRPLSLRHRSLPLSLLLAALSVVIVVLASALAWALRRLQRRVDVLHGQLGGGTAAGIGQGPSRPLSPGRSSPVIEIRILNPFELATREVSIAGHAAKIAPRMIERIVYFRAAQEIQQQLKEQGVEAQVTTHGA